MALPLPDDPIALAFNNDPLTLDPTTLARVVAEFRRRRSSFHSEEAVKALKPPKAKAKLDSAQTTLLLRDRPISEISLEDLD